MLNSLITRNLSEAGNLKLSRTEKLEMILSPRTTAAKVVAILMLLTLVPGKLAAQGQPVETGSHLPVALWFIGAGVLGLVLAYGIVQNRRRTRTEKRITEQATKDLYDRESRNS